MQVLKTKTIISELKKYISEFRFTAKNILSISLMAIFVGGFSFLQIREQRISEKYYKEYYEKDVNGIVKCIKRAKGGELILCLDSKDIELRTGVRHHLVKQLKFGDSISKPAYSEYLFQFRKMEDSMFYKYYYIHGFDKYEWKRPWNYETEPDWKEMLDIKN